MTSTSTSKNKNIGTKIFEKLTELGVIKLLENGKTNSKSETSNFMPLSLDKIYSDESVTVIALSHYYKQNGDLMADPDMEIAIHKNGKAEALTFQQDNFGIFQQVYDIFPSPKTVKPDLKKQLNDFLNQWLTNCIEQRHSFDSTIH